MEQRFHRWLQSCLYHLLCDSIRHCGNAQLSFPTVFLRYLYRPHRWWKVAARRHPIPDLVQVVFQVPLKIFDRLFIDPCCSFIRFHPFVRFPDLLPGNTKRLCLIHRAPPIAGWLIESGSLTQRLGSIPLSRTSLLLRAVPSLASLSYFRPRGSVTCGFSVGIEVQVPTFRSTASLARSEEHTSELQSRGLIS